MFQPNVEKLKARKDIQGLIKALRSSDRQITEAASEALVQIGPPAVDMLDAFIEDKKPAFRYSIACILAKIGDPSAYESFTFMLEDSNDEVRKVAIQGLGIIGDERSINQLISMLSLEDRAMYEGAMDALGQVGLPAIQSLLVAIKDQDKYVRFRASTVLIKIGEEVVEPLIMILEEEDNSASAFALGEIGDKRAVESLITVLRSKESDNDVKEYAACALGKIGDKRAVEPLITVLQSKERDNDVKGSAAWALGKIGDKRAVEPLITVLQSKESDNDVKGSAAWALGKLGDKHAVEPLVTVLQSDNSDEKLGRLAAFALGEMGKLGDARVFDVLVSLLSDPKLLEASAIGLGELGDKRAVEPLLDRFKIYWEAHVGEHTQELMGVRVIHIGPRVSYYGGCKALISALGEIGDVRAADTLRDTLKQDRYVNGHRLLDYHLEAILKETLKKIEG